MAVYHLTGNEQLVLDVKQKTSEAEVSGKLKALLAIAAKVQSAGKSVLPADIEAARQHGATDMEKSTTSC